LQALHGPLAQHVAHDTACHWSHRAQTGVYFLQKVQIASGPLPPVPRIHDVANALFRFSMSVPP
jgi:hypothetical protein